MSYYPDIIAMDARKCSLPVYSGRKSGEHKHCPTDVDWTKHVIGACGLIAVCENEGHNYADK